LREIVEGHFVRQVETFANFGVEPRSVRRFAAVGFRVVDDVTVGFTFGFGGEVVSAKVVTFERGDVLFVADFRK